MLLSIDTLNNCKITEYCIYQQGEECSKIQNVKNTTTTNKVSNTK